ncbi:zinc ribbon domain-containing protein [uncultured Methanobrevibacter sp.]|uniref:zinc ribbon domain-containing protein n=1 Tax=uncultured Methanobrevibacter sp. TaxID=253161 RepID=UPI0025D7F40D|nr:zinc ribbon domain-containing protein [uncultured Methanobrevibacter sp.]
MVFRRCPQCGSTSDDAYGFCIKCGHEFPEIPKTEGTCPLCGFQNPEEADFCVKCGTPLIFKNQLENNSIINPVVITKTVPKAQEAPKRTTFQTIMVIFGYLFSILGGLLGLIIAIYLVTRKNPSLKKHGYIQLAIFIFYIALIIILYATGNIPGDIIAQYRQILSGNITSLRL